MHLYTNDKALILPQFLTTVSLLDFTFMRLIQEAGHFDVVLCSSHISLTRYLIVLLNSGMTLTVSESSSDLSHLYFVPPEKNNKHTLSPFLPCLQHLAVTYVSPLHLLWSHSIAACSTALPYILTYREALL